MKLFAVVAFADSQMAAKTATAHVDFKIVIPPRVIVQDGQVQANSKTPPSVSCVNNVCTVSTP